MDPDREQRARDVIQSFGMDEHWIAAVDPDSPEWLEELMRGIVAAFAAGDLESVLENTDPEVEIVQPPELPDGRIYCGLDGFVECLLDWPSEWEDFRVEPTRIYALGDSAFVIEAMHRGRSLRMGLEIEVEIFWLYTLRNGRTLRWDMFMSREATLAAAESG
jgi:ketosteroid isomerase-like protein